MATVLSVDSQWVSGFLDGFAQEPESSADAEYTQGSHRRAVANGSLSQAFAGSMMSLMTCDTDGRGNTAGDAEKRFPRERVEE